MNTCRLGYPAERPQHAHSDDECVCPASCEPHIHGETDHSAVLCLHDGETDHGHCPNA